MEYFVVEDLKREWGLSRKEPRVFCSEYKVEYDAPMQQVCMPQMEYERFLWRLERK